MVNELTKLKERKEKLKKGVKKLEEERDLLLSNNHENIKNILNINSISCGVSLSNSNRIVLSFQSNSFFNRNIVIDSLIVDGIIKFSVNWSSGTHNERSDINAIDYINSVLFVLNSLEKSQDDFYISIKDFFVSINDKDKEINKLYNELHSIEREIENLELEIKKESFYKNLKDGNFYYTFNKPRFSTGYYEIVFIEKVNPKTSNVYYFKSTNIESVKFYVNNITSLNKKRIRNNDLFVELSNYSIFTKDNFEDIITKHQIKINMIRIYKDYDINFIKDIKKLCKTLYNFGTIDKDIPDNNILSMISEKRHHLLKYGHTE